MVFWLVNLGFVVVLWAVVAVLTVRMADVRRGLGGGLDHAGAAVLAGAGHGGVLACEPRVRGGAVGRRRGADRPDG
ncbi:hypothetical protein D9B85_15310, partial [Corynebacterium diphtheriae]